MTTATLALVLLGSLGNFHDSQTGLEHICGRENHHDHRDHDADAPLHDHHHYRVGNHPSEVDSIAALIEHLAPTQRVSACNLFPGPPPDFRDPDQEKAVKAEDQGMKAPNLIDQFQSELDADKKLGKEASDYYDRAYPASKNIAGSERVKRIGEELSLIANSNPIEASWGDKRFAQFEYKFKLVQSKDINAFSLPGGYIYVFEGLLDFCQSDDELAGVLAHEITHASQRHVAWLNKEASKASKVQIPLILAGILTGGIGGLAASALTSQAATTALTNGWGQKAEDSADFGGFQYMIMSQYDATGLLTFMERLRLREFAMVGVDMGIFRTHPPSKFRAERIEGHMRKNNIPIRRSRVTTSFRTVFKEEAEGSFSLLFGKTRLFSLAGNEFAKGRAEDATKAINNFMDQVPQMFEIRAEGNGRVSGRGRTLIQVTQADADLAKTTIPGLQRAIVKSLQDSLFRLAVHAWD